MKMLLGTVLALVLGCGGGVSRLDAGEIATTRLCYLSFQPSENTRACSVDDPWTWSDDAGVHTCVVEACPLAAKCFDYGSDGGPATGTCR